MITCMFLHALHINCTLLLFDKIHVSKQQFGGFAAILILFIYYSVLFSCSIFIPNCFSKLWQMFQLCGHGQKTYFGQAF